MSEDSFTRPAFNPQRMEPCFCGSGRRFKSCCGSLAADRSPPHGVQIKEGFLDPSVCRDWLAHLSDREGTPLGVLGLSSDQGALELQRTSTRITDAVSAGGLRQNINKTVRRAFTEVIAPVSGHRFAWFEKPQILRYQPGGWYSAHADSENIAPGKENYAKHIDRDYSLLIYLNEDFEGGGLELVNFNYRYRPRIGDLLFFPSDNRYLHQALPVKSGERWVVVSWAACVDEPKVYQTPTKDSIPLN